MYKQVETKIGTMFLEADQVGLKTASFKPFKVIDDEIAPHTEEILQQAENELLAFFEGKRQSFTVPLHITSGTTFQRKVWQILQTIPYGHIWSYQDVAVAANSPLAVRAVGQANRANPLPIFIPCHRVIGKNGKLTGYSGSGKQGLVIKQFLLDLEVEGGIFDAANSRRI